MSEPDPRVDRPAVDWAFLEAQTFGDATLQREVLQLFLVQLKRLAPELVGLPPDSQTAAAHLLKGSCQGIGAEPLAELLNRFGSTEAGGRRRLEPELHACAATLEAAIVARLAAP